MLRLSLLPFRREGSKPHPDNRSASNDSSDRSNWFSVFCFRFAFATSHCLRSALPSLIFSFQALNEAFDRLVSSSYTPLALPPMTYLPAVLQGLLWSLILRWASRQDAFSVYPIRTSLPCYAVGTTTVAPVVRPFRSSRTRQLTLMTPTPTMDRDRTVSRRSEPSSRAAGVNSQTLGTSLPAPGCDEADIEVPNLPRRCGLWGDQPVIPGGSFYPLSDGFFHQYRRITKRLSSLLDLSISQSGTLLPLRSSNGFIHSEVLGASVTRRRPPHQTVHLTLSILWFHRAMLEFQ